MTFVDYPFTRQLTAYEEAHGAACACDRQREGEQLSPQEPSRQIRPLNETRQRPETEAERGSADSRFEPVETAEAEALHRRRDGSCKRR